MNQNPIFILGAHKSGTTLLRNIFDGHSLLYTVPVESHFFQHMNEWIDNEYRQQRPDPAFKSSDLLQNFYNYIHKKNTSINPYGESTAKDLFDEDLFKNKFNLACFDLTKSKIFEKYIEAIYYSINQKQLSDKFRIIEKSVEHAEFAIELSQMYPHAKFIHILRNPYSNLVSLRKFKSKQYGYPIIRRLLKTLYNNYYYLLKNKKVIENYYIIRYEDLVSAPKKYIKEICNFLDLPFEKILLTPTYQGEGWGGNSMEDKKFSTISSERLEKWKQEIHPMEVKYINHLFDFIIDRFGYQNFDDNASFWRPAKGENIKRYFANRIYRFYLQEW